MARMTLDIPTMYADHHVLAVQDVLSALPGISDVYASAAFQQVALSYDSAKVSREQIEAALAEHGYGPGQPVPVPRLEVATQPRYVTAHGVAEDTVRFSVEMASNGGRPLPCPGFEPRVIHGEHPADQT